ncbi:hypothetical protein BY458DRAFT_523604, partial [Sporodiniella umbellata]
MEQNHVYLLRRLHTSIGLYQAPHCLIRPSIVQPQSQSIETNASSSRSRLLNTISNNEAAVNTFKNSSRELTNEQIRTVSEIANNLSSALQDSNDLASNSIFSTKRKYMEFFFL